METAKQARSMDQCKLAIEMRFGVTLTNPSVAVKNLIIDFGIDNVRHAIDLLLDENKTNLVSQIIPHLENK